MPLRILRSRTVAAANLVQMLMVAALFSFQVLVALYLQQAAETGLAMLPAALAIGGVSLGGAAKLIARFGSGASCSPASPC